MVVVLGSKKHVFWEAIWWHNWVYFQLLIWQWLSSHICFRKKNWRYLSWFSSSLPPKAGFIFSSPLPTWPLLICRWKRSRWPYTWASSLRLWSGLLWCGGAGWWLVVVVKVKMVHPPEVWQRVSSLKSYIIYLPKKENRLPQPSIFSWRYSFNFFGVNRWCLGDFCQKPHIFELRNNGRGGDVKRHEIFCSLKLNSRGSSKLDVIQKWVGWFFVGTLRKTNNMDPKNGDFQWNLLASSGLGGLGSDSLFPSLFSCNFELTLRHQQVTGILVAVRAP